MKIRSSVCSALCGACDQLGVANVSQSLLEVGGVCVCGVIQVEVEVSMEVQVPGTQWLVGQ